MGASTTAIETRGAVAAGGGDDAAAIVGNQLDTITTGTDALCETAATRSIVRVLVRATVRRHTRVSYVRLDGSHDDESEGEAASPGTTAPELLLCSEMSFVMSSSVLLPSPSHNCG